MCVYGTIYYMRSRSPQEAALLSQPIIIYLRMANVSAQQKSLILLHTAVNAEADDR